jgi:hypothetical protein
VSGVKELGESPSADLAGAAGPVQFEQLGGPEELQPPYVADDLDVARLQRARHEHVAPTAFDNGAVVAPQIGVAGSVH